MLKDNQYMTPHVGDWVQFWPNGGKGHSNVLPIAALVTERGIHGQVRLDLFPPNFAGVRPAAGFVRYHFDPWVNQNMDKLLKFKQGRMQGTWDWIHEPEFVPDGAEHHSNGKQKKAKPDESAEDRRQRGWERVDEMLERGRPHQQIAKTVRTFGLKEDEVNEYIENCHKVEA